MRSNLKGKLSCSLLLALTLLACGGEARVEIDQYEGDDPELSASAALGGCREGNCLCFAALADVMDGRAPDPRYQNNLGPEDVRAVFSNGGSENIPLTCRTVHYWAQNNPNPAWLESYFELQLATGTPSLFGGEVFSSTYSALMVGDAIAVLARARQRGHVALVEKASRYLEAYFTALALGSVEGRVTSHVTHNRFGLLTESASEPALTVGLVGSRSYVNGHNAEAHAGTTGLQGVLLAMALDHPQREFRSDLRASPGYYGGLRAAVSAAGYSLNSSGRVTLTSQSVPAEVFGLTEARRAELLALVRGGGASGALSVLRPYELSCELTVLRTTGGVISWWGTSDSTARPCNARKGGSWAVAKLEAGGVLTLVTRSNDRWGGGDMGTVWRDGAAICAESSTLPRLCVPLPPGSTVYELVLGRSGARCVSGACGGPPAPPPPQQGTFGAAFVSQAVPAVVAPGARFAVHVTMRNSGTARWSTGASVRLGSQAPQDNLVWGLGRVDLPAGVEVAPGASHTFSFEATAPSTPGARPFQWQLLREGLAWFGASTAALDVEVR